MRQKIKVTFFAVAIIFSLFIATVAKRFVDSVDSVAGISPSKSATTNSFVTNVTNFAPERTATNTVGSQGKPTEAVQRTQDGTRDLATAPSENPGASNKEFEKHFDHFIRFLRFGPSKVSQIDYDLARREIAISPKPAVEELVSMIEKSAPHDVEMRQGAFAALAQVVEDVKLTNPNALDEIVKIQIDVVRTEVGKEELMPNDSFSNLTTSQKEELTHLRPFKLINGKIYSISLPAQLGAMFSLGIAGTPLATDELVRISKTTSYSPNVRAHASRMLNSNLFN